MAKLVSKSIDLEPPKTPGSALCNCEIASMIAKAEIDSEAGAELSRLESYIAARAAELEEMVKGLQADAGGEIVSVATALRQV